jgi:hypothetical protein
LEEVQDPKYRLLLKNDTLHSLLYPNLDDLKLLQMSLDHESLKLEPKEKSLAGIVNVFNADPEGSLTRPPTASRVELTHLGSGGTSAGSGSKDSSGGR